jgi:hypothetical protein
MNWIPTEYELNTSKQLGRFAKLYQTHPVVNAEKGAGSDNLITVSLAAEANPRGIKEQLGGKRSYV